MDKQNLLSVVVADDEQELLGAVCQLIDWAGIGFKLVGRASNGLDALQLVEELQPDFLLTDIHMPFISGTALAAQVKAVQNGNVWCTAQSLFQQSMELPDLILDMNRVFTEGTPADSELTFLTHVE